MPKLYRKKPVEIEAMQYTGDNVDEVVSWLLDASKLSCPSYGGELLSIQTLEGHMLVSHGDYVIKGVKDEFYPCKPDIFVLTYEEVEDYEYSPEEKTEDIGFKEALIKVHNLLDAWGLPNVEKREDGWDRVLTAAERLKTLEPILAAGNKNLIF